MKNENTKEETKTIINGIPPQYDQTVLDHRINEYKAFYKSTSVSCVEVKADNPRTFLELVIAQAEKGYTLNTSFPISLDHLSPSCLFSKPESQQQEEMKAGCKKLKEAYVNELELEHQSFKLRLVQQLRERDEAKLKAKQEKEEAVRLAAYQKAAEECYSPLIIPAD